MNRYASALFTREFGFADTCRCAWQVLPKNGGTTPASGPCSLRGPRPSMLCALLLFLLPGMTATDNAICAVMSPLISGMDSVPGMKCSCVSDGTALNAGGDAQCELQIGPPPFDALKEMIIKIHMDTTVRPCAEPAMAALSGGITLPQLSQVGTCYMALEHALQARVTPWEYAF